MRKLSVNVRTHYTIAITADDLSELLKAFNANRESNEIIYKDAFIGVRNHENPPKAFLRHYLSTDFKWEKGHADAVRFIAEHYGFDGWEQAGCWYDGSNEYRIGVYHEGDRL